MNRAIHILLLLFLIGCGHLATAQQRLYISPVAGANMRSGAGTSYEVVTTLPANSELKVLSKEGEWYKVESNGRTGYVHSSTVSENRTSSARSGSSGSNRDRDRDRNSSSRNRSNSGSRSSAGGSTGEPQEWGIGLRLGDPTGITVKKYFDNKALELSIGRSHMWYGRGWYGKHFNDWYDKRKFGYKEYQFLGYDRASVPLAIQLHYLVHKNLMHGGDDMGSGLLLYFGGGAQLRYQTFYYHYRYKIHNDWIYVQRDRVSDLDLGIDGVIGLEYKFDDVPISIFLDGTLFLELADDPFVPWGQAGLGIRYNF